MKKGNRAWLIVGGCVLAAAVAAILLLFMPPKTAQNVIGSWINDKIGQKIVFDEGGSVLVASANGMAEGKYTFDSNSGKGVASFRDSSFEFTVEGNKVLFSGSNGTTEFARMGSGIDIGSVVTPPPSRDLSLPAESMTGPVPSPVLAATPLPTPPASTPAPATATLSLSTPSHSTPRRPSPTPSATPRHASPTPRATPSAVPTPTATPDRSVGILWDRWYWDRDPGVYYEFYKTGRVKYVNGASSETGTYTYDPFYLSGTITLSSSTREFYLVDRHLTGTYNEFNVRYPDYSLRYVRGD